MTMGTKVYTKQCMYSLKQSHGAVEKKMLSTCFLKKMRKREKEKSGSMLEVYKHEE